MTFLSKINPRAMVLLFWYIEFNFKYVNKVPVYSKEDIKYYVY